MSTRARVLALRRCRPGEHAYDPVLSMCTRCETTDEQLCREEVALRPRPAARSHVFLPGRALRPGRIVLTDAVRQASLRRFARETGLAVQEVELVAENHDQLLAMLG